MAEHATVLVRRLLVAVLVVGLGPVAGATAQDQAAVVGGVFSYTARPGDSLTVVSARFGVELSVLRE